MSAVSETIVREFFELHGYLVRQQRKFIAPNRREDEEFDFFVLNPNADPGAGALPENLPFILTSQDLDSLVRAIVVVKGWHTETFSPGMLAHAPEIFRFVEPSVFRQAERHFGRGQPLAKILVVPALPHSAEARQHSIDFLRAKGVDAIIPFRLMLNDLIEATQINRNYQKSDLLQIIRIFKNYDFFAEPQMELFGGAGPVRRPRKR
jgi:hypothetical protein